MLDQTNPPDSEPLVEPPLFAVDLGFSLRDVNGGRGKRPLGA